MHFHLVVMSKISHADGISYKDSRHQLFHKIVDKVTIKNYNNHSFLCTMQ